MRKNSDSALVCLQPGSFQVRNYKNRELAGIADDSRLVKENFLFCAVSGAETDGKKFIPQAIAQGASVVVHQGDLPEYPPAVTFVQVDDSRVVLEKLAAFYYDYPAEKLKLYALTGTNGKTTTAYLFQQLSAYSGRACGMLSTVEYVLGNCSIPAERTTPGALALQQMLARMVENQLEFGVMEVSSHALCQHRIAGLRYSGALFSNLTGDHLDYHGTMEEYYQAKKLLFTEYLSGPAVVNVDDGYGRRLCRELRNLNKEVVTFGISEEADRKIILENFDRNGCTFFLQGQKFFLPLLGQHNVYNAVGAILLTQINGLALSDAVPALTTVTGAPGRLQHVRTQRGVDCFVDYAHTDDALANVLGILRKLAAGKRLLLVFGCGGNRDQSKRPRMGRIAGELADFCIVCNDNPRNEDPDEIIRQICSGMPAETDFAVEPDREQAIRLALSTADAGDLVLIAGKGHERYQEIAGQKYPFCDLDIVRHYSKCF